MKGVIYARFSSHAQREESIEQQVEECMAFAAQNDIEILEVYADKAVSGRTDDRKEFQRMLRDAQKKKFEAVVAYKSNRISRNMLNALTYEARLEKLGIATYYAREEFGNTPSGRFALRMMMNMNQFYSENMAEDIRRGLMDNAQQCKANGSIAYGYRRSKDGYYEINEGEAEIVKLIFNDFVHGIPYVEIANKLNGMGLRTRRGKVWTDSAFVRILANESYIGTYHYSGVRIENGVPPIISRPVFAAAQERLKQKKTHRKGESFLLTGKLFCGECGSPMTGLSGRSKTGRIYYYYICRNHRHGICDKKVEPKSIEQDIADIVRQEILVPETIEQIADALMEYQDSMKINEEREMLKAELADLTSRLDNLFKAVEQGLYGDTVANRILEYETRQKLLEEQIKAMQDAPHYDREHIIFALTKFASEASTARNYTKTIIDTFIKAVYMYDDRVRIDCYYGHGIRLSLSASPSAPPNTLRSNPVIVFDEYFSIVKEKGR